MNVVAPIVIGFAFGWILQRAGLARYERIVNVFLFRDLTVLKFLLTALVVASIGVRGLAAVGIAADVPVPATYLLGNAGGGVVFGVGMALSGFCPGTVAAGAGEGRLDYLIPGGLGLYAGAVIYGFAYDKVMPPISKVARFGNVTLPELLHVEPWLLLILFAEIALLFFYLLERAPHATRSTSFSRKGSART